MEFEFDCGGIVLACSVRLLGGDCVVTVAGGDAPHIGSVAVAMPRESLTGRGRSATTSTINRTGHKDDFIANPVAHEVAARTGCVATCVAGVHVEGATAEQIRRIQGAAPEIARLACTYVEEERNG